MYPFDYELSIGRLTNEESGLLGLENPVFDITDVVLIHEKLKIILESGIVHPAIEKSIQNIKIYQGLCVLDKDLSHIRSLLDPPL